MQQMALSYRDIKNNAHQFVIDYTDAVKENAESQSFLNDFFSIFGVNPINPLQTKYFSEL